MLKKYQWCTPPPNLLLEGILKLFFTSQWWCDAGITDPPSETGDFGDPAINYNNPVSAGTNCYLMLWLRLINHNQMGLPKI